MHIFSRNLTSSKWSVIDSCFARGADIRFSLHAPPGAMSLDGKDSSDADFCMAGRMQISRSRGPCWVRRRGNNSNLTQELVYHYSESKAGFTRKMLIRFTCNIDLNHYNKPHFGRLTMFQSNTRGLSFHFVNVFELC